MRNRVTITLTIDIPDGIVPNVEYGTPPEPPDLIPLASQVFREELKYDPDEIARPTTQGVPGCPQHGAMTRFPAGTSKKTGKAYGASWRCGVQGCETKPIWDKAA